MAHSFNKRVRGFHCDAYGHVNNARYLEFLEEARWQALESDNLIAVFDELKLQFFVVNVNISFKQPIRSEQTIEIVTNLGEAKRKTISFIQTIFVDGVVTNIAEVTFVLFDLINKRAITITDDHLNYFKQFRDAKS